MKEKWIFYFIFKRIYKSNVIFLDYLYNGNVFNIWFKYLVIIDDVLGRIFFWV